MFIVFYAFTYYKSLTWNQKKIILMNNRWEYNEIEENGSNEAQYKEKWKLWIYVEY